MIKAGQRRGRERAHVKPAADTARLPGSGPRRGSRVVSVDETCRRHWRPVRHAYPLEDVHRDASVVQLDRLAGLVVGVDPAPLPYPVVAGGIVAVHPGVSRRSTSRLLKAA